MTMDDAHKLFEFKLQAMHAAEKRNLDMLEDAVNEAKEPRLRDAFAQHREETEKQVTRIEGVFETFGRRPRSVDPSVVEGLVEEKRRFLAEDPTPEVMDLFHLGAGMQAEHVEIAAYETLILLAEQTGTSDAVEPLRQSLEEEKANLERLRGLAKDLPVQARQGGGQRAEAAR